MRPVAIILIVVATLALLPLATCTVLMADRVIKGEFGPIFEEGSEPEA